MFPEKCNCKTISIKRALKTVNGSKVVKNAPVWDCNAPGSLKITHSIFLNLCVSDASARMEFLVQAHACVQGTLSAYPDMVPTLSDFTRISFSQ